MTIKKQKATFILHVKVTGASQEAIRDLMKRHIKTIRDTQDKIPGEFIRTKVPQVIVYTSRELA